MNLIKGILNRIIFFGTKLKLKKCGKYVLFESLYEVEGEKYISVGSNVRTKSRFHIAAIDNHNGYKFIPEINIGSNVSINYDVHIACINKIDIGDGTLLASKIFITDHFHGNTDIESMKIPPSKRKLSSKGPVIIGRNVWIGEGAVIMPGVTIGDNSIIGANSVVTSSVPEFSIAAGVPAVIIKNLSSQVSGISSRKEGEGYE